MMTNFNSFGDIVQYSNSYKFTLSEKEKLGNVINKFVTSIEDTYTTQRIAVLGDCNVDNIQNFLSFNLVKNNIQNTIYIGDPGNYLNELLNLESGMYQFDPDIILIMITAESLQSIFLKSEQELSNYIQLVEDKLRDITKVRKTDIFITEPSLNLFGNGEIIDRNSRRKFNILLNKLNNSLQQLDSEENNFHFIDMDYKIGEEGNKLADFEIFYAKRRFSNKLMDLISLEVAKVCRYRLGLVKKCLVLDLDNTLWGGILAEGEVDFRDDFPGNDFKRFQYYLKHLRNQGVLLAINSKNDFDIVYPEIGNPNNMILDKDDFVCIKINWLPKDQNIREIAQELNIGEDSMVFIDDSDFERGIVALNTQASVLWSDATPLGNIQLLNDEGWFDTFELTKEDRERSKKYIENTKRTNLRQSINYEDYLDELNLQVTINEASMETISRITQLNLRTNQFNMTTKRYEQTDFEDFIGNDSYKVFQLTVSDSFGDYGLCGCILIKKISTDSCEILNMILSCRVFERGIEYATLDYILKHLFSTGQKTVYASFIQTKKNVRFSNFYSDIGFSMEKTSGDSRFFAIDSDDYDKMINRREWININT